MWVRNLDESTFSLEKENNLNIHEKPHSEFQAQNNIGFNKFVKSLKIPHQSCSVFNMLNILAETQNCLIFRQSEHSIKASTVPWRNICSLPDFFNLSCIFATLHCLRPAVPWMFVWALSWLLRWLIDALFWRNFGRPATPGKIRHCFKFSPFRDNGSHCGLLESQRLRNCFITLFETDIFQ